MIIEILETCSGEGFLYKKGTTVEQVPEARANDLWRAGYAKIIGEDAIPTVAHAEPQEAVGKKRKATKYETPEDGLNVETR